MKNYKLNGPCFIDPRWLCHVQLDGSGVVDETGKNVIIHDVVLSLDELLNPGTPVKVWLDRNFYCNTVIDLDEQEKIIEKQRMKQIQAEKDAMDLYRKESEKFNNGLNIPVPWTTGQKDVLSGLSASSWGDGRRSNTVNHILLQEDMVDGRLQRSAGDFLCTSSSKNNGKQWSGSPTIYLVDGHGEKFLPKVTCKQCLKLANRWINKN